MGSSGAGAGRSAAAAYGAQAKPRTDSLAVSYTLMEVMRARYVAAAQPDVRADKVAALKQQISNGTYQVDTKALAARMLAGQAARRKRKRTRRGRQTHTHMTGDW